MNYKFDLQKFRYSTIFRGVVVIDLLVITTLWIIGGAIDLKTVEIDQIIKFNYVKSVFDCIIMTSLKSIVVFILISELETIAIDIIFLRKKSSISENTEISTEETNIQTDEITTRDDVELNVDFTIPDHLKYLKSILHLSLCIVLFICLIYTIIKFSFVLNEYNDSNPKELPFNVLFLIIIIACGCFSCLQFILSLLSWHFMRKLENIKLIEQSDKNKQDKPRKINLRRVLSLAKPETQPLFYGFIALLGSSATQIVTPYYFGKVIDAAEKYPDLKEMNFAVLIMFLIYLFGSVASGIRSFLFEYSGTRVVARLRRDIFGAIIRQDIKFFDVNRTGELTSRISSDTQVLQNAVTVNISMLLRYIIQILGSIVFMFTLEPSLTGVLLAIVPIVSIAAVQYGRYLKILRKQFQDYLAAAGVTAEESISSVRTMRSFGAEKKVSQNYDRDIDKSFKVGVKLALAGGGFMLLVGILTAGAISLVLWYGGKLVHEQKITTGLLSSFLMFTLQVALAFAFLMSLYGDFMQAVGASQRIFEILDTKTDIPLNTGITPKNEEEEEKIFDGSINLKDIYFSYPTRKETNVLTGLAFEIEKGQTVALVGPSGGGKSTVFSLIQRFYDPDQGSIIIGPSKTILREMNLNYMHTKISMVSQEPVLFGGTIKENITFGKNDENVDMNEVINAAKLANAHGFISSFEKGYDTVVGERGVRLSGGQKQRIAIARALLMNPKLLLLDEATSALDSESEHLVQEAMNMAMKGRTVCVIAHRLSTVRNANVVIVLDGGKIVEKGTHDELIALNGVYKQLVLRQMLSKDDENATVFGVTSNDKNQ